MRIVMTETVDRRLGFKIVVIGKASLGSLFHNETFLGKNLSGVELHSYQ